MNGLFSQMLFPEAEQKRREAIVREIQGYDMATILTTPLEQLVKRFEEQYAMHPPRLKTDEVYLLDTPQEITTRNQERDRIWRDEYVNVNRSYIQFTVCVPFEGDSFLLSLQPTSYTHWVGRDINASIEGNEIHLSYQEETTAGQTQRPLDAIYQADTGVIQTNIQNLTRDADIFNRNLLQLINQQLADRKKTAEANQSLIQSLKIPIKKRGDVPTTYAIPEIRRKPSITETPKVKTFTPEPTLAIEEYETILNIIKDMALAMERSPATFAKLTEEEIRDFFIILLNGHYQGSATGETFNGIGKTDILIRHKNANAFIAECKFWSGQKKMGETIDQLLGYITWRDTKTAILLFNKQPDLSAVVAKAKEAIKQHQNFKSENQLTSAELMGNETISGYKFKHPSDPDKEIFLTLMAFQIKDPLI